MLVNTWALLIGLACLGIPVLIHWLTRPRPVRVPVSTLRFIRGAVLQRRARYRLRDLIVLLLRTLAIILIALALARPLLQQRVVANNEEQADVVRIVLLDCSQSMAAREGGITHIERARPAASDALKFRTGMKANLLLSASSPQPVFDGPTTNLRALRDALAKAKVRPERLKVQPALNLISEMFQGAGEGARLELLIISDLQRSNWASADFSVLPKSCSIQLKPVTSAQETPNLALLGVTSAGRVEAGREAELAIQVANFSDTPRHARVELSLGPAMIPVEGHLPPRSRSTLGGRMPISREGWLIGSARLLGDEDALPADNGLAVSLESHAQPRMLLLTRDRPEQIPSAGYYAEIALASIHAFGQEGQSNVTRVDAADPDPELLRAADVLVLVRPGRLTTQTITVLAAMIQRGRSLLYLGGDPLDAANLKDLSSALGSAGRLPVEFSPQPTERQGEKRFLTDVDRRRSPFSVFGDELGAALRSLEFSGGLVSRATSEGLADDVRATFSDQSAFLTVTSAGRGRLAVMNVELDRSNLALTPVLVPLLAELITEELAPGSDQVYTFPSGEAFTITLPVGEERVDDLTIVPPDDADDLPPQSIGTLSPSLTGVVWEVPSAGPPGVYQILLENKPVIAVVISVPVEESDLRLLPADVFENRLSGGRDFEYQTGSSLGGEEQDTFWVWLAAGCLICVFGEFLTLKLFRT